MKKYKVNFTASNGYTFAGYYDTRKEAADAADKYPGKAAKVHRNRVEMIEHHTATARGYRTKGAPFREYYRGMFGTGYVEHYANAARRCSNRFHVITYFVEVNK